MSDEATVERVARAIYEASIPKGGRNYVPFDELDSHGYEHAYDIATLQAKAAIAALQPQDEIERVLADPVAVHLNMLRGGIAKPSIANIIHLYGADALRAALPPQGDGLAELRALLDEHDKACGVTKYTPSFSPPYAMTMDVLHRQTFAAMYAHVRAELERKKD